MHAGSVFDNQYSYLVHKTEMRQTVIFTIIFLFWENEFQFEAQTVS